MICYHNLLLFKKIVICIQDSSEPTKIIHINANSKSFILISELDTKLNIYFKYNYNNYWKL